MVVYRWISNKLLY